MIKIELEKNGRKYGFIKVFNDNFITSPKGLRINKYPSYCIYGNILLQITDYDVFMNSLNNNDKNRLLDRCELCNNPITIYGWYDVNDKKIYYSVGCPLCEYKIDEIKVPESFFKQ